MNIRHTRAVVLGALLISAAPSMAQTPAQAQTPAPSSGSKTITNENRLFQRFIEDGAVTAGTWVEPQFRFARFDNRDVYSFGPTIAFNIAEDIEVGGRIDLETLNFNPGGTQTGFSDMEVYGKVRLTTAPTQVSLGALLKFPTGDSSKGLGTGKTDVEFFLGYRRDFKWISFVGNGGFRITQDPQTSSPGQLQGETSVLLGGAALFPFSSKSAGVIEASYESERINGAGADFRLTAGWQQRHSESFMSRIGLAWGAGGSAPDFQVILSGVYLF